LYGNLVNSVPEEARTRAKTLGKESAEREKIRGMRRGADHTGLRCLWKAFTSRDTGRHRIVLNRGILQSDFIIRKISLDTMLRIMSGE
jgi:hypothetical protein